VHLGERIAFQSTVAGDRQRVGSKGADFLKGTGLLKGTGFSPYINSPKNVSGLQPLLDVSIKLTHDPGIAHDGAAVGAAGTFFRLPAYPRAAGRVAFGAGRVPAQNFALRKKGGEP
jgi:hypothetical protein